MGRRVGPAHDRTMIATAPIPDFPLASRAPLSAIARRLGLMRFGDLAVYLARLRTADGGEFGAALGSTLLPGHAASLPRHRLLAAVARECGHADIQLAVAVFEMHEANTPGVGPILQAAGLASIPECRVHLLCHGVACDCGGDETGASPPLASLLSDRVVTPAELPGIDGRLHRRELLRWLAGRSLSFARAWMIRTACMDALAARLSRTAPRDITPLPA